jgi:t-SNARE complex subunit (syntaxin)
LENQVERLKAEAANKDMIIAKLEATVTEKPKEEAKKVKKVKKVKKISCFPISVVVFSLVVFLIAWWLKLNGSFCEADGLGGGVIVLVYSDAGGWTL